MKFISYYTGQYQWDAEQLIKSFGKLKMTNYEVDPHHDSGQWETNTQFKATFIKQKLQQNDAVVWTDADSRVRQHPILFDELECDVALFFIPAASVPTFQLPPNSILSQELVQRQGYLQSGTMYFKNTPVVNQLIDRWIELNALHVGQWDQWTLQVALAEISSINVYHLPPSYVWIDGMSREIYGNIRPVVEHTQASRRSKKRR